MNNEFNNGQPMNNFNGVNSPQTGVNPMPANTNPGVVNPQNPGMVNQQMPNNTGMATGEYPQNNMNPGYPQYGYGAQMPNSKPSNPIVKYVLIGVGAVAVLLIVLLVTGVIGGKTLTCTRSDESMGITMSEEFKFHFSGDEVNKVSGKYKVTFEDPSMKEYLEESFTDMKEEVEESGAKASISSDDKSITVTITATKDAMEEAMDIDVEETQSYEELKEEYEDNGYTCK